MNLINKSPIILSKLLNFRCEPYDILHVNVIIKVGSTRIPIVYIRNDLNIRWIGDEERLLRFIVLYQNIMHMTYSARPLDIYSIYTRGLTIFKEINHYSMFGKLYDKNNDK